MDTENSITLASDCSLKEAEKKLINDIIKEEDPNLIKAQFQKFEIYDKKRDLLKKNTYNNLEDALLDKMLDRIENTPGEFSHSDLVSYLKVVQAGKENITKQKAESTSIQNTQVNIVSNTTTQTMDTNIDRDSRENIIEFFKSALKNINASNLNVEGEVQTQEEKAEEVIVDSTLNPDYNIENNNLLKDEN